MEIREEDEDSSRFFVGDSFDLLGVLLLLWQEKWKVIIGATLMGVLSALVSLQLPNTFVANSLLAPRESSEGAGGLGQIANQLGGLASFTGLEMGGGQQVRDSTIAIETVRSLAFFTDYIYEKMVKELVAVEGWKGGDGLIYDSDIFDVSNGKWSKGKPSAQNAYGYYWESVLIEEDPKTKLITLSVTHYSPRVAKNLADLVITSINEKMRSLDVAEAEMSIAYLSEQRGKTNIVSLDQIFGKLIEDQTKKIMLANVSKDYVFRVIEPPVVPEGKSGPSRGLIVIVSTILSGFFCSLILLVWRLWRTGEFDDWLKRRKDRVLLDQNG